MDREIAKPWMGPEPSWARKRAAIRVVRFESMIVQKALSKPALIAAMRPLPSLQLLLHALEDQDVRVDRHADREHEAGDGGQGEGEAEGREDADHDDEVDDLGEGGVDARALVVEEHEDDDEDEADRDGQDARADRVLAEGGADRLGVDGRELDGKGRGAEDEGQVGGLLGAEAGHAHRVADGLGDRRAAP